MAAGMNPWLEIPRLEGFDFKETAHGLQPLARARALWNNQRVLPCPFWQCRGARESASRL